MVLNSQVVLEVLVDLGYLATQLGHYFQLVRVDLCLQDHQRFRCHLTDLKVQRFLDFQVAPADLADLESLAGQIVLKSLVDHFGRFVLLAQVVLIAQKAQKVQNRL